MGYPEASRRILDLVGGDGNVTGVVHCATRLRFTLRDESKADVAGLEAMPEVLSVVRAAGQFQVVIGPDVDAYYTQVKELLGSTGETPAEGPRRGVGTAIIDYLSGTMAPLIPALIGCSVLRGFLVIFVSLGLLDEASATYSVFYAASNSVYYFLPILAGFSAASKLKANPYVAACIMGSLLVPQFTALYEETGNIVDFLGLPLMMFDYSSSLFPALFGIGLYSLAERWLDARLPKDFKVIITPMIGIAVFVPLTALVFGPFAYYVAQVVAAVFDAVYSFSPLLSGVFVGGFFAFLVLVGVHWAVVPVVLTELSVYGFSKLFGIWWFANVSQFALPLGVIISTKDKSERNVAFSYLFTCLFSGITEPIMFTYVLRDKRFAVPIIIAGGITGGIGAMCGVQALTFTMPSILTLATVTTEAGGLPLFCALLAAEMVIGALVTKFYVYGRRESLGLR